MLLESPQRLGSSTLLTMKRSSPHGSDDEREMEEAINYYEVLDEACVWEPAPASLDRERGWKSEMSIWQLMEGMERQQEREEGGRLKIEQGRERDILAGCVGYLAYAVVINMKVVDLKINDKTQRCFKWGKSVTKCNASSSCTSAPNLLSLCKFSHAKVLSFLEPQLMDLLQWLQSVKYQFEPIGDFRIGDLVEPDHGGGHHRDVVEGPTNVIHRQTWTNGNVNRQYTWAAKNSMPLGDAVVQAFSPDGMVVLFPRGRILNCGRFAGVSASITHAQRMCLVRRTLNLKDLLAMTSLRLCDCNPDNMPRSAAAAAGVCV